MSNLEGSTWLQEGNGVPEDYCEVFEGSYIYRLASCTAKLGQIRFNLGVYTSTLQVSLWEFLKCNQNIES